MHASTIEAAEAAPAESAADRRHDHGVDQRRDGPAVHDTGRLVELVAVGQPQPGVVGEDLLGLQADHVGEVPHVPSQELRPEGGPGRRERLVQVSSGGGHPQDPTERAPC